MTDFRYREQSEQEVKGWDIVIEKGHRIETIRTLLKKSGITKLGFEDSMSYDFFRRLLNTGVKLKVLRGLIENLREVNDTSELRSIKEAVRRAEEAFREVKSYIKKGMSERAIAMRLEEKLKKKGCRHIPFDIIVASGPNSAMPHAKPTERRLSACDLVIIDWGGEADGYLSDMTRTFLMKGSNIHRKKEIYQIVLEANRKAIASVVPGVRSKQIDSVARDFIRTSGYGNFFGHGTGHGVGLQMHELPRISWDKRQSIRENMVFTIEPGIYIPGMGGVRIEDMVAVGNKKAPVLTSLPKVLEIV